MMKITFCFTLKISSFFQRYLNFCSNIFGNVRKPLEKKAKVIFRNHDVTKWQTNNCSEWMYQGFTWKKSVCTMNHQCRPFSLLIRFPWIFLCTWYYQEFSFARNFHLPEIASDLEWVDKIMERNIYKIYFVGVRDNIWHYFKLFTEPVQK